MSEVRTKKKVKVVDKGKYARAWGFIPAKLINIRQHKMIPEALRRARF